MPEFAELQASARPSGATRLLANVSAVGGYFRTSPAVLGETTGIRCFTGVLRGPLLANISANGPDHQQAVIDLDHRSVGVNEARGYAS